MIDMLCIEPTSPVTTVDAFHRTGFLPLPEFSPIPLVWAAARVPMSCGLPGAATRDPPTMQMALRLAEAVDPGGGATRKSSCKLCWYVAFAAPLFLLLLLALAPPPMRHSHRSFVARAAKARKLRTFGMIHEQSHIITIATMSSRCHQIHRFETKTAHSNRTEMWQYIVVVGSRMGVVRPAATVMGSSAITS